MRLFKCPECGEEHSAWQWNRCTNKKLIANNNKKPKKYRKIVFVSIKDDKRPRCWYVCPSCGKPIDGKYIKVRNGCE